MLNIEKKDILKTFFILWFVLATGYVLYDQYLEYKLRGMQASYQQGIADSVSQLIEQTQKSGCVPFEVTKDKEKIQLVDGQCLQQSQIPNQQTSQTNQVAPKK